MGRKPNALIAEFFERGEKLADSSNRYQHTCRSCGEKFPKGRIDTLQAHILKSCPAIPPADRERAYLQLQDPQSFTRTGIGIGGSLKPITTSSLAQSSSSAKRSRNAGPNIPMAYAPAAMFGHEFPAQQHAAFSGLETLAEAAKTAQTQSSVHPDARALSLDPHDFLLTDEQIQQHQDHLDSLNGTGIPQGGYLPAVTNIPDPGAPGGVAMTGQGSAGAMGPASRLALTASAANDMIPVANQALLSGSKMPSIDRRAHPKRARTVGVSDMSQAIDPSLREDSHGMEVHQSIEHLPYHYRAIPEQAGITLDDSEFDELDRLDRRRQRARFSPSRRKEVQDIRKQGACVRCRMLKKPCSGGTPCTSCISVEAARLWKQPCIRSRITEAFDLFSCGIYAVIAFHEVTQAKNRIRFEPAAQNVITATHSDELSPSNSVSFSTMIGQTNNAGIIDPALLPSSTSDAPSDVSAVWLLNQDQDEIVIKLEQYFKQCQTNFIEEETSVFMQQTLKLGADLALDKKDPLLGRCLELWCATHVLADSECHWNLYTQPKSMTDIVKLESDFARLQPDANAISCRLIVAQLHAFTEKRAMHLAKSLMNELERRLLLRSQTQKFETFLIGVIILNCVERMCWLLHVWQQTMEVTGPNHLPLMTPHVQGSWPLDQPPSSLIEKAERFCDLLVMLLRMRAIPPKTAINAEGYIVASSSDSDVEHHWFDCVRVRHDTLLRQQEQVNQAQNLVNSRSWEMKYVGKLLLPES